MQTTQQKEKPAAPGLVVSIHDVSPGTREAAEVMRRDLMDWGVGRVSLLVTPNHHHRGHFLDDAGFCRWVDGRVAAGDEVVLHGYFHLREPRGGESLVGRMVTESYTAGEGEFFDLEEEAAFERVTKGRDEFRRAGWEPARFIAPAWLLGPGGTAAVRRAGFQYTTRLRTVDDLASDCRYGSQSLVYSVRAGWRRAVSLVWNSTLLRSLGDLPLVRIGLHPPDWRYPAIRDHARKCIIRALATREAITYEDWLGRQRAWKS